jgi:iodotyrosine deiodinase
MTERERHDYDPRPLDFVRLAPEVQRSRAVQFHECMARRRTVREFSPEPVPLELVEHAVGTAASAPSGANQQPWRFVVVTDPSVKRRIREAAETVERESYERRMPDEWLEALAPLGTDWHKPFLEIAPVLIVVFRIEYGLEIDGEGAERRTKHYYVNESVGLACGFLLAALQYAGLATLTHTPSPMGFLAEILERPGNEKPFLLIPVGYPAEGTMVPSIARKPLDEVMIRV